MNNDCRSYNYGNPVDEAERQAVRHDLNSTFWVEAGAGTGKTRLLIERLFNLVTCEGVRLDEIVAITFTEKAAGEIKTRLREKLEENCLKSNSEMLLQRINYALEEIESAPIMTIHSFAARLLRERPVEAGIDPHFEILDQEDADVLREKIWEKWFLRELGLKSEPLSRAVKYGFSEKHFRDLARLMQDHQDLLTESTCAYPPDFPVQSFLEELKDYYEELASLASTCKTAEDLGYLQFARLKRWMNTVLPLSEEELIYSILHHMPMVKAKGNKNNWKPSENCSRQKNICETIFTMQKEILEVLKGRILKDTILYLHNLIKEVAAEKDRSGVLEFNDLLLKARNLLKDNAEIRNYFQKRFRFLLVDEFQDTDPLQAEIIFFLAEKTPRASRWNEVEITPGKLFIVGDPKQSIYRFRRADIEVYEEAKECVEKQGKFLRIVQNFRTVPSIIEWVNFVFSRLIVPQAGSRYQPRYEELHSYRREEEFPAVKLLSFPPEVEKMSKDEKRSQEACAVASFIKEAVGSWEVWDEERGIKRLLDYGDIGILYPNTTGLEFYQQALQEKKLPYHQEGGRLFYQRREVQSFINLLRAIDNPYDSVALVAALQEYFGVSPEDLFLLEESGGSINYLHHDFIPANFKAFKQIFTLLARLHGEKERLPLPEYLGKILRETGIQNFLMIQHRGEQAIYNLEKIVEISRSLEHKDVFSLRQFIRWLMERDARRSEESESIFSEKEMEAIQLSTIHRAKGLEFNLVLLVNLMAGGSGGKERFLADRLGGRFELKGGPKGFATYGFDELAEIEKARLEAEKKRLFYVGATRARDYLIIPRIEKEKPEGFLQYLQEIEGEDNISREISAIIDESTETEEIKEDGKSIITSADIGAHAAGESRGRASISAKEAGSEDKRDQAFSSAELIARRARQEDKIRLAIEKSARPLPTINAGELADKVFADMIKENAPEKSLKPAGGGTGLGSAFHHIMEKINICEPASTGWEYHLQDAASYWGLTFEEKEELSCLVKNTVNSSLIQRACKSKFYREVPFTVEVDGWILEGLVDILYEGPDGIVIVDYKTDDVTGSELEKRFKAYRLQGLFYALALHTATGKNIREINIYFVKANIIKKIENPSLAEIRKLLFQFIPG